MIPLRDNLPSRGFPLVTVALIALSLLGLGWQLAHSDGRASTIELAQAGASERDSATIERGAIPYRLAHPGSRCGVTSERIVCGRGALTTMDDAELIRVPDNLASPAWWSTPFSSMLIAVDALHLAVNLLFLLIFGRTLEASLGRLRFALLYLGAGLLVIGLQTLAGASATGPVLGASGAVAGLLGVYAASYPRARVVGLVLVPLFATPVETPALALIAGWFLLQLVPAFGQVATPLAATGALTYASYAATFLFGFAVARALIPNPLALDPPRSVPRGEPARG